MAGEATRRGLLASAGAAAVTLGLEGRLPVARATTAAPSARPDVVYRGRSIAASPDGRRLLALYEGRREALLVDRRANSKRKLTLGGHPLEAAFASNGRYVALTTAFWDQPGLELIDAATGNRRARVKAGGAPFAVAFTADGRHLLVTGGEQDGTLRIYDAPHLHGVREVKLGRVPRAIAVADRKTAWVALNGEDAVVRVDIAKGRVTKRLPTLPHPDRLALSPDGNTLLITHPGRSVTELDTRRGTAKSHGAGAHPSAVAWTPKGRLVVRDSDVLALDPRRRRIATVAAPRGLAVAGRDAFVVSALTGEIGKVRA
jgi:DNA-binding beta-propeller fold protein YncE